MRLLDAGQNLPTRSGESAVAHSPPVAIATPPPLDCQEHLANIHAAGQQQRQRPQVKLPLPEKTIRLPVISAPETRASSLKRENGIIQPASSIWQDKISRLLGTRRLISHAPRYNLDSGELSVATKVPLNDALEPLSPSVSITVLIPRSRRTDGPRDTQDLKDGTAMTKEVAVDRRVSTAVSTPIADVIPATALKSKSLQGKHDRGQTRILNLARDEAEASELDGGSPGSEKAFVSIPADVSESLRVLLMSDKILNTRLAPAPEAPKAVLPETVQLSEDEEESAERSSDVRDPIFISLVGLGKKKVMRLRPNLDMSLSTAGHEFCHDEIAVAFEDRSTKDGPARLGECTSEDPGERSGDVECSLTIFGGEIDAQKLNRGRCVKELDILEDAERSDDQSFMTLQSKDKDIVDRSEYQAPGVMIKYENATSISKDESVERLITLGKNIDAETESHNEGIIAFTRLVGIKDFNSGYFDIRDGLLSNRIGSNLVL